MSDAWRPGSITGFEQVPVGRSTVLLRVTAGPAPRADTGPAPRGDAGPPPGRGAGATRPTLVADDGHVVNHFAAIPSPPDRDDVLRAAYSVPARVVHREAVFSLELADGSVIALPDPWPGAARVDRQAVDAPPADLAPAAAEPGAEVAPNERRSELQPKITELTGELAEVRHESRALRSTAAAARARTAHARARARHLHLQAAETSAELQALRDLAAAQDGDERLRAAEGERVETGGGAEQSVEPVQAERDVEAEHEQAVARLSELEIWSAELERRLAETTTQLATALSAAASDESELRRLRGELAEAEARVELGQARIAALGEPGGADPAMDDAGSQTKLERLRRAAVADAHEQAERDLRHAAASGHG